jgi:hypothetical protein
MSDPVSGTNIRPNSSNVARSKNAQHSAKTKSAVSNRRKMKEADVGPRSRKSSNVRPMKDTVDISASAMKKAGLR